MLPPEFDLRNCNPFSTSLAFSDRDAGCLSFAFDTGNLCIGNVQANCLQPLHKEARWCWQRQTWPSCCMILMSSGSNSCLKLRPRSLQGDSGAKKSPRSWPFWCSSTTLQGPGTMNQLCSSISEVGGVPCGSPAPLRTRLFRNKEVW